MEVKLKEGLPLFPRWSRKSKRREAWKPKPRGWQDDGEQDSGFAPEFQIITGFFLFDSLQPGGEPGRRMGRASRAFTANRFQLGNGWITKAWGAARGSPCGRARVSAGAGRIQVSGPGEATPAAQIPGPRSQPQSGSPVLFPASPSRHRRLQKQPSSACYATTGDKVTRTHIPAPALPSPPAFLQKSSRGKVHSHHIRYSKSEWLTSLSLSQSCFFWYADLASLQEQESFPKGWMQISYFLPPLTLRTDPGMRWLIAFNKWKPSPNSSFSGRTGILATPLSCGAASPHLPQDTFPSRGSWLFL